MNDRQDQKGYNREETWGELYEKAGEEKTGGNDFRGFAELFKERGIKGYDKGEKAFGSPDKVVNASENRFTYPAVPQDFIDLHGLTVDEAEEATDQYISRCRQAKLRFVKIITGVGKNSPGQVAKLRPAVIKKLNYLIEEGLLKTFESAPLNDGGYGAIYVYFK